VKNHRKEGQMKKRQHIWVPPEYVLNISRVLILLVLFVPPSPIKAEPLNSPSHSSDTMVFTLDGNGGTCTGCDWITAEGPITQRTPQDFDAFLNSSAIVDGSETIKLNSNGGSLVGASFFSNMQATDLMR
jgi:hypothetical protein